MSENKRITGVQYEVLAARYLIEQGLEVLEQNYRSRQGEIDLIARDGEYLVFIEVKYRKNDSLGFPEEAVDLRKQQRIVQTAGYYLYQQGYGEIPCRFDVIAILGSRIRWLKHAF